MERVVQGWFDFSVSLRHTIPMKLSWIQQVLSDKKIVIERELSSVSIDSRTIVAGQLYIAIIGHQLDGHHYVQHAIERGAAALIVDRPMAVDIPQIVVEDTTHALGLIAQAWREQYDVTVFAITGSTGKTSTRNMLASILQAHVGVDKVLVTQQNFNNQWGLPLTLLQLTDQYRYAVIEMGMCLLGDIQYLSEMAQPDIAIITQVNSCHIERTGSLENIAKAKGEIMQGLSNHGCLVLNQADAFFAYHKSLLKPSQFCIAFGEKPVDLDFSLKLPGAHQQQNAYAAIAAARQVDVSNEAIVSGLANVTPEKGRLFAHQCRGITVLDDSYNAHPVSVRAALQVLATYNAPRLLVLGDMAELGEAAVDQHRALHADIKQAGVDYLFTYGNLTRHCHVDFSGTLAQYFSDQHQLINVLLETVKPGMTILVKGSRSMRMEKVVQALLAPA